jgi:NPCBM/NEW2 domain
VLVARRVGQRSATHRSRPLPVGCASLTHPTTTTMTKTTHPMTTLRNLILSALSFFLLAGPSSAADTPVASDPVFGALLVDGTAVKGRIRQFSPNGDIVLVTTEGGGGGGAGGQEKTIPASALVKLTRENLNQSLAPEPSAIFFPGGDRLYRTAIGAATDTSLEVQSYSLDGKLAIPLEAILGLIFAQPNDPEGLDSQVLGIRTEPRTNEMLWLANGDKLSGSFLGLSDKAVEFQSGKTDLKLDRGAVVALGFDPALVVYPKPPGVFFEVTLADGSRLGVREPRLDQGHLVATSRFGATLRIKIGELTRVHPRSAQVAYLSERKQAGEVYEPYVGLPRAYRRDSTVDGHTFRLSGQDYDRGIGTESRTMLAYRVEPEDKRFQVLVGLDDRAGPLGSVVFRVLVDRVERFRSPAMSVRDAPLAVDLDIAGAKSLILITEFGARGGVRDLADWVEARFVR